MLSRVIYGARVSLEVGIIGTALATVIGVVIGLLAGFYRGWVDTGALAHRATSFLCVPDRCCSASASRAACAVRLPRRPDPAGHRPVIFIIVISGFTYIARIVRGQVLSLREKEFVEAARSLGASNRRIMFREILPNLSRR